MVVRLFLRIEYGFKCEIILLAFTALPRQSAITVHPM